MKYKRSNNDADDCNARMHWTMTDNDGKMVKDLRTETKRHALQVKGLKPSYRRGYDPISETGTDYDRDSHLEPHLNILKRLALEKDVGQTFDVTCSNISLTARFSYNESA